MLKGQLNYTTSISAPGGFVPRSIDYPPSREFNRAEPLYNGKPYWEGVDDIVMEKTGDYNSLYVNASSWSTSEASTRFAEGELAGQNLIKQLDEGTVTLNDGETIKIVGHSQGGAFAAGLATALSKNSKYASKIEYVVYLAPFEPTEFTHPKNIQGYQALRRSDKLASANLRKRFWRFLMKVFTGYSKFGKIKNIADKDFTIPPDMDEDKGGHFINTFTDYMTALMEQIQRVDQERKEKNKQQ